MTGYSQDSEEAEEMFGTAMHRACAVNLSAAPGCTGETGKTAWCTAVIVLPG